MLEGNAILGYLRINNNSNNASDPNVLVNVCSIRKPFGRTFVPDSRMKNVEWVVGVLRNGDQECHAIVPRTPEALVIPHNYYQTMYYQMVFIYARCKIIIINHGPTGMKQH